MKTKEIAVLGIIAVAALGGSFLLRTTPGQHADIYRSNGTEGTSTSIAQHASSTPVVHASTTHKAHNATMASSVTTTTPFSAPVSAPRTQYHPQVHLTIIEPDGKSSFDVDLINGDDLCENLREAKQEGDIHSLTLDDTYLSTFGSLYVREINGYGNNWTVEVLPAGRQAMAIKPEGCTLYKSKAEDEIIWRFGV